MKKLNILRLLSTVAIAAAGIFGIASVKESKKAGKVEAGGTTTLFINHFNSGNNGGEWTNFSYYLYGSGGNNGAWPGQAFTSALHTKTPNQYNEYKYKLEIDTNKYQYIILSGYCAANWNCNVKTQNIEIASLTENGLYVDGNTSFYWSSGDNANVFSYETFTQTEYTVYMLDLRGNVYNTTHNCHAFKDSTHGTQWPGFSMTKVSGYNNLYSGEINTDLRNVVFNAGNGGHQSNDISNVADGDVYILYPDDGGYNKTTLDAARFIDKYMKFETVWMDTQGTGACKNSGWYSSAKSVFNLKTAAQRSKILEHEPTSMRLEKWAIANGESMSGSNILGAPLNLSFLSNNKNQTAFVLIIVSVISVGAIGGYFFIRKRKEN